MFGLIWKDQIAFGDVLTVVGFLLTLAGLVFAGWQFRQTARVQRAGFLVEMADRVLAEKPVEKVFYEILEKKFTFNPQSPPGPALDALLHDFNLIGCLLEMRVISPRDVGFFRGEAWVVLTNGQVNAYIQWANAQPDAPPWRRRLVAVVEVFATALAPELSWIGKQPLQLRNSSCRVPCFRGPCRTNAIPPQLTGPRKHVSPPRPDLSSWAPITGNRSAATTCRATPMN
ncbi:MAG TPA: hypothetical protein VMS17_08085 [Gemmataceae bacterium]|nr:hypothetical protein [Gemmataceae bacterium]